MHEIGNFFYLRVYCLQTSEHTGENLTFNQLRNKSYSFANALKLLDAKKGDIVVVCLENCYQYAVIFLGSAIVGCSISGIHPESTERNVFKISDY